MYLRGSLSVPTYMVTDGSRANLVIEFETFLKDLLSLSVGEVAGVSVGGRGNESRLTDSEFEIDEKTLLGR